MRLFIKVFTIASVFFFLGFAVSGALFKENDKSLTPKQEDLADSLDYLSVIDTPQGKIYVLISKDTIYFQPFEDISGKYQKNIKISRNEYPNLFGKGVSNMNFILVEEDKSPDSDVLIRLSNNQPDHGTYSSTYTLLVNPSTGEINEIK